MGLFGRSAADQQLIEDQANQIEALKRQVVSQDYIIARGSFRDPSTQRMGKTGRVPGALMSAALDHAEA